MFRVALMGHPARQRPLLLRRPPGAYPYCQPSAPLKPPHLPCFLVHTGVPVLRWPRADTVLAYWGIGLYWGRAVSNNKQGHLVGHIKVGRPPSCPAQPFPLIESLQ